MAVLTTRLSPVCGLPYRLLASLAPVIPSQRHRAVGKETGQTSDVERFNHTVRQRIGRLGICGAHPGFGGLATELARMEENTKKVGLVDAP